MKHLFRKVSVLTPEKISTLQDWYTTAIRDSSIATEPDYAAYYDGLADGYRSALSLLHDKADVAVAKASKGSIKGPMLIVVAVGATYLLLKHQKEIQVRLAAAREASGNTVKSTEL